MNAKIYFFFVVSLLALTKFQGQSVKRSLTYIDTYYHGEKHFSIKEVSEVYHNTGNSEIQVEIDFSKLKTGVDSLDEWIIDLSDTKLIFKGHLPVGDLLLLSHHNMKSLEINGEVTFNGKTHPQVTLINFYEISKDGILFQNTGEDYYDRIAAHIQLTILPKHFGVNKKPHHLKKKISIAIGKAIINKL